MKHLLGLAVLGGGLALAGPVAAACTGGACPVLPDVDTGKEVTHKGADAAKLSKTGKAQLEEADAAGRKVHLNAGKLIDLGEAGLPGPESGPRKKGDAGAQKVIKPD